MVEGVPLPFHGEASRAHWTVVEATDDRVTLRTPARLPLILERRMTVERDAPVLRIEETVHADAAMTVPFLWGHHPAFPAVEGATIDLPAGVRVTVDDDYVPPDPWGDLAPGAATDWPEAAGRRGEAMRLDRVPAGPLQRLVFLGGFPDPAWAAVRGVAPGVGVGMAWDRAAFPVVWNWWELEGPGHPWHGRARIVAIEPATAWPADGLAGAVARGQAHTVAPGLAGAVARGQAHTVAPGRPMHAWLTMTFFDAD
jgi:galactose mutarotase-like enzyme